jgi:hypothetical protein
MKRLLLATALALATFASAQAAENLESAGFFRVYVTTCYADLTPQKQDLYVALALKDIERFGKDAVEQAAQKQYQETVYKQGAADFCKITGWILK